MKTRLPLLILPFLAAIATTSLAGTDGASPADQTAPHQDIQNDARTDGQPEAVTEPVAAAAAGGVAVTDGDGATDVASDGAADVASEPQSVTETTRVIAELNAALLNVLQKSNDLDYAQRFALLAPTLESTFDLEYMARQVVGRGFLDLDEESRARWYQLFAAYMTANYASRFDHFANQRFEIIGEDPGAKGTVLVRTRVLEPTKDPVALSYRVRETDGTCKVIDVYLKGTVSEIALRRSEYASVLKREGFDALVTSVEARIEKLAASADSSA